MWGHQNRGQICLGTSWWWRIYPQKGWLLYEGVIWGYLRGPKLLVKMLLSYPSSISPRKGQIEPLCSTPFPAKTHLRILLVDGKSPPTLYWWRPFNQQELLGQMDSEAQYQLFFVTSQIGRMLFLSSTLSLVIISAGWALHVIKATHRNLTIPSYNAPIKGELRKKKYLCSLVSPNMTRFGIY